MSYAFETPTALKGPVIDSLRADGIDDETIVMAINYQESQRGAGVPVFPLRVICGLDQPERRADRKVGSYAATLAKVPRNRPGRGGLHVTHEPVWAKSVQTGSDAEAEFPTALTDGMCKRIMNAAYRAEEAGLKAAHAARRGKRDLTKDEQKLVGLTKNGLAILRRLLDENRYRKGWVFPSYETMAEWLSLGRSTIIRQLKILARLGLTEWLRRFDYERSKEAGSRSTQTSNLYRFGVPKWLSKLLKLDAPLPADETCRREQDLEDHAMMLADTPRPERRWLMPKDPAARSALIIAAHRRDQRVASELQSRECHRETEPQELNIYNKLKHEETA